MVTGNMTALWLLVIHQKICRQWVVNICSVKLLTGSEYGAVKISFDKAAVIFRAGLLPRCNYC